MTENNETALLLEPIETGHHCIGYKWSLQNLDRLAKIIALIAMGQAKHASMIIQKLDSQSSIQTLEHLRENAKIGLQIIGQDEKTKDASRYQRDGFLFEAISWVAARQIAGPHIYLKDPHIRSNAQGLDGLMIEVNPVEEKIVTVTIFEDKCSKNPRKKFSEDIMEVFMEHHRNKRSTEFLSVAVSLISECGKPIPIIQKIAEDVFNLSFRHYRAALTVTLDQDSEDFRCTVFKGYEKLDNIASKQRIGALFIVEGNLRNWFEALAIQVIANIDKFKEKTSNV